MKTAAVPKTTGLRRLSLWDGAPGRVCRCPGGGAMQDWVRDRPHGRCNAAHCLGYGLPRRCAPRNHHVFSHHDKRKTPIVILRRSRRISCTRVSYRNPLREILRLWHRMTGRGCGGCFITMTGSEAGCVGMELPGRFAGAWRGQDPRPTGAWPGGGCVGPGCRACLRLPGVTLIFW